MWSACIGAVWFLWLLGYNLSIAVWVGIIALMGLDAETGIFMLLFLDLAHEEAKAKGLLRNRLELIESIIHGAVKRVRPKAMTVFAATFGLVPIMCLNIIECSFVFESRFAVFDFGQLEMQVEYSKPETVRPVLDRFRSAVATYVKERGKRPTLVRA